MPNNNAIVPVTRSGIIQTSSSSCPIPVSRMERSVNHIVPTTTIITSLLPKREIRPVNRTSTVMRPEVKLFEPQTLQHYILTRDNNTFSGNHEVLTASSILASTSQGNRRVSGRVKSIRINTQRGRQAWASELNNSQQQFSCINLSEVNEAMPQHRLNKDHDVRQMQYINTGASTSQQQSPPVEVITPSANVTTAQYPYRGEGDSCELYAQQQKQMVILTRGAEVYSQLPNLRPALELVNKVIGEVFRKIKNPEHVGEVMDAIAFCTGIRPESVTFAIYRDFLGQVQSLLHQAGTYLPGELNENQFAIVATPPGNIMAAATIPQDPHHRIWFSCGQAAASLAEFFKHVIHELGHMFTTVNPAFDFIYLIPQGCNEQEVCDVDELQRKLINEVAHIGHNVHVREAYFKNTMKMLGSSYPDASLHHLFNATTSAEAAYSIEYNDWLRYVLISRTSDLLSMLVMKLGYEKFINGLPPQARSTANPALDMAKIEAIKDRTSINLHLNTICNVMSEVTTDFRAANGIMRKLASIALPYPVETAQWLKLMGGGLPNMMDRLYRHEPKNAAHVLGTINCILTWLMERGHLPAAYVKACILPIPYTYHFYDPKNSKEIWQDKLINCWVDLLRSYLRGYSPIPQQRDIENLVRILIQKSMSHKNIPGTVQFYKMLALELERRMNWFNHVTKNKQPPHDQPKSKKVKAIPDSPDSRLMNLAHKQRWYVAIEDISGEFLRGFNPAGERIDVREMFDEQFKKPIAPDTANILCTLREQQENGLVYYHGTTRDGRDICCENDENNLSRAAMASYRGQEPAEEEVIMLARDLASGEDSH